MPEIGMNVQFEPKALIKGFLHDLNNMFTCTLNALGAAQQCDNPDILKELIGSAHTATLKSTELASLLIRIWNGYDIPKEPESLQLLLIDAVNIAKSRFDVPIEMEINEPQAYIVAESIAITNVFLNILLNSWWALDCFGIIRIVADCIEQPLPTDTSVSKRYARVRFSDNGCGIPREKLDANLQPTLTFADGDHGIGLQMIRIIVGQHQGAFDIETQEGKGTTITVLLPMAEKIAA